MADTDRVISMAVIESVDASPAVRAAYLKRAAADRRLAAGIAAGEEEEIALTNEEVGEEAELSDADYEKLKAHEQYVLTVRPRSAAALVNPSRPRWADS